MASREGGIGVVRGWSAWVSDPVLSVCIADGPSVDLAAVFRGESNVCVQEELCWMVPVRVRF